MFNDSRMHRTCFSKLLIPSPFSSPMGHLLSAMLGVVSLSQALCSSDDYSNSLLHLDLSKNPGVLSGEDATVRDTHSNRHIHISSSILLEVFTKKFFFFFPPNFERADLLRGQSDRK